MNRNIRYTIGKIGRIRAVKDFLPSPASLVLRGKKKDVDGRDIAERTDAVLRTTMPRDDGREE